MVQALLPDRVLGTNVAAPRAQITWAFQGCFLSAPARLSLLSLAFVLGTEAESRVTRCHLTHSRRPPLPVARTVTNPASRAPPGAASPVSLTPAALYLGMWGHSR